MGAVPFVMLSRDGGENSLGQSTFIMAMINTYLSGVGEYGAFLDPLQAPVQPPNAWFIWILFIFMTLVIQVMMLNLIIGIIGQTYNRVLACDEAALYWMRTDMTNE